MIRQKYIDMVGRFNEVPKRSVERIKMLLNFSEWYRRIHETLSDEEKEYLQEEICKVDLTTWTYVY